MLSVSSGHSPEYYVTSVAGGRENYYTGAVTEGEPPGRWYGRGAAMLGLSGEVVPEEMTALYEHFIDPRDEAFNDPERWPEAARLGHTGRNFQTEAELYAEALDAEPDADAERREQMRLEAGKRARKNVAFIDATFSVQKSVTVLHTAFEAQRARAVRESREAEQAREAAVAAGDTASAKAWQTRADDARTAAASWASHATAVEDAIWAGNRAAVDYLADKAGYSRVGHHGGAAGRFVDAHDWVVASFFQHDSRDRDPQLHIHNAILNRVQGPDGKWRTLDSRALHKFRGAASAVGERTTEEHLTRALGIRFATRPDGKAREVVGVEPEVMALFSSRRRKITKRTEQLVGEFQAKFGREPNSLELDRLQRQATLATRAAKSHEGETGEARLDRWDRELRAEVATGLAGVADAVLDIAGQAPEPQQWSPEQVIETALAAVQEKKAAWTAPDLTRALSDALPDRLGDLSGEQVTALLDGLTAEALTHAVPLDAERPGDAALPDDLRLNNGASAYSAPGGRLYATKAHVHTERTLVAATSRGGAPALADSTVSGFVAALAEQGIELGADQAAAVRGVLRSGAAVESLVGPAGTGKSFVVGTLAKAWTDPALWAEGRQRRVVGLAASQIATEVLTGEGLDARNIASWLAAQRRLRGGNAAPEDRDWTLRGGDLVVVDESAMADTTALAEIHQYASETGAKLLLVGDHRQLAAVGAGGAMELMAEAGSSYELADARRFRADWERAASLRLREGDRGVIADYHRHGRVRDGGRPEDAEAAAGRAWLADTLSGKRSLLIVDSNEQAARMSAHMRAELVRLGRVSEHGVPLGLQGTFAGVGDVVQARRNGWELIGRDGNTSAPINRRQYTVVSTSPDGDMRVRDDSGWLLTLPAGYVNQHVALAYASTTHAAQGVTVDTSHTLVTATTAHDALYVGMTRGRQDNVAHVVTTAAHDEAPDSVRNLRRSPAAVLDGVLEQARVERSALATAVESADEMTGVRTPAELLTDAIELATAGRTSRWLDELVDEDVLTEDQRQRLAAEDGAASLNRLLRRAELAGHDPRRVLADAITARPLTGARQLTNVIHHRISDTVPLDPQGTHFADWTPQVDNPEWQRYLDTLAARADQRRVELGSEVAANPPQWAVEALGVVPEDPKQRALWVNKAGIVAAHRDFAGHDDPAEPLGNAPKPGQAEAYASWRAAWRALDRPEVDRDELEMSDGQLHIRVRAYEREKTWSPKYVAQELAGTRQAAAHQRETAALRQAEAVAATDPADRQRLLTAAADAAALADVLDGRAALLADADDARAEWLAHTAGTRAARDRAVMELKTRRAADGRDDDLTTASEWLAEHHTALAVEDRFREITDLRDFADFNPAHQHPSTLPDTTADVQAAWPTAPDLDDEPIDTSTADSDKRGGRFAWLTRLFDRSTVREQVEQVEEARANEEVVQPDAVDLPDEFEAVELTGAEVDEAWPDLPDLDDDEPAYGWLGIAVEDDDEPDADTATATPARTVADPVIEPHTDAAETDVIDLRDAAETEPPAVEFDELRVPSADETADTIARAQRALAEIRHRQAADAERAAEDARAEQLARWATDDAAMVDEDGDVLTRGGAW